MDVIQDVHAFLQSSFDMQGRTLAPDDSLLGSGILDSMGLLRLIAFLEDRYDLTVGDGDVIPDHFGSLRRIQAYVERKTGS